MKHMSKLFSILLVTLLFASSGLRAQYCLPTYSTGCSFGDGLTLFQLGTINQSITCTAWYHDYTASSTSLTVGVPATITVQAGYSSTYVSFYIDYNHNNAFDGGELIGQVICAASATNYTLGFTVPGTALTGPTRLRALTEWISYPSGPCTSQTYGNCEDFTVNISGAYCTPSYTTGCAFGDGLTLFQLGTINQPVTCTGSPSYYHDWTASSTNLTINSPATLTVQAGYSSTYVTVWVDLNNNYIFEPSEILVNNLICASSGVNYTAPITIPTGTSLGNHRLRFRTSWASSVSDPCVSYTYGNAGDFTVNVITAAPPTATTAAATLITCFTAQSNGTVNANGNSTTVSFDYGLTASYGSNVAGIPATVTGASATPVSAPLSGLLPNTLYHYRVKGANIGGTTNGGDMTFTTSPAPVPTITGPITACTGIPGIIYTTEAGMNGYTWAISAGGSITAGLGTNSVTVTWNTAGAQFVSVNYTNLSGCSASSPTTYNVSVGQLPVPTITGSTNMCVNSGYYFYTTESGMNTYAWTISPGGTILSGGGTNSIMVAWNTAGAQSVSVNYANTFGCWATTATIFGVTVDPMPGSAGTITGTQSLCVPASGIAYSVAPVQNAVTYVWTLPPGVTVASGAGTNSITVDFAEDASSGDITVYGNNICGNGTVSPPFTVTANPYPDPAGVIAGPVLVCKPDNGIAYSVDPIPNATGYQWAVPAGASVVSGSNTNSITVDFGENAVSGDITVLGTNACGNGAVSPALTVSVNAIPEPPVISFNGGDLTSSSAAGNQWIFEGIPIPGATGQTYTPDNSGDYWDIVTIAECSSDTSNHIYVLMTGIGETNASSVKIYPVPNDGRFMLKITGSQAGKADILIFNNLGSKVLEMKDVEVNGILEKQIDLRPAAVGIYSVVVRNGSSTIVKKVIVVD